jgi:S1-C subfamily serine protease
LYEALEQLERQMSAGMLRARDSVVALEYTAREGPPGARRLATGVVINLRGDVLSVRIDPPASSGSSRTSPGKAGAGAPAATSILAHDALGKSHLAHWVAADLETGLTLLQIAPRAVRPIQMASFEPTLGSQVVVVGNPFGLGHTVSRGHIAGLDRVLKLGSRQLGGLIQVQAPLYPGDSGAVVANIRGQLLGLIRSGLAIPATSKDRPPHDNDFGFALAIGDILWVAEQLHARGHVERAYLGVRLEPVAAATSPQQPETEPNPVRDAGELLEGALLLEVIPGTPAALAGLRAGDAIIAVDGQPVRSPCDLTDRLDRLPAHSMIHLVVVRGRGPQQQKLTHAFQTGSRPEYGTQTALSPAPSSSPGQARQLPAAQTEPATATTAPGTNPTASDSSQTATSTTVSSTAKPNDSIGSWPEASAPISSASTVPPVPDSKSGQADSQFWRDSPAPVSIPGSARSPLRAVVQPPQAEELKLTLPRAVAERLEQMERRLEKLERPPAPTSPQEPRQASSARTP